MIQQSDVYMYVPQPLEQKGPRISHLCEFWGFMCEDSSSLINYETHLKERMI